MHPDTPLTPFQASGIEGEQHRWEQEGLTLPPGSFVTLPAYTPADAFADYKAVYRTEPYAPEPPHVTDTVTWQQVVVALGWWIAAASVIALGAMAWALWQWTEGGLR